MVYSERSKLFTFTEAYLEFAPDQIAESWIRSPILYLLIFFTNRQTSLCVIGGGSLERIGWKPENHSLEIILSAHIPLLVEVQHSLSSIGVRSGNWAWTFWWKRFHSAMILYHLLKNIILPTWTSSSLESYVEIQNQWTNKQYLHMVKSPLYDPASKEQCL